MRVFKRAAVAAMSRLSGSLTSLSVTTIVGASGKAYFAGGQTFNSSIGNWVTKNIIRSLNLVTEVMTQISATLSQARSYLAGVGSRQHAYFAGGYTGSVKTSKIDSFLVETDTIQAIASTLSQARPGLSGISGPLKGYFMFGNPDSGLTNLQEMINYATNNVSSVGVISSAQRQYSGSTQNDVYGVVGGGENLSGVTVSTISLFDFGTHTVSLSSSFTSGGRTSMSALSSAVKAYFATGRDQNYSMTGLIEYYQYSNRTNANLSARIQYGRAETASAQSSAMGYIEGGTERADRLDQLDFITETRKTLSFVEDLSGSSAKAGASVIPLTNGKGVYVGGYSNNAMTTIESISFNTEVMVGTGMSLNPGRFASSGIESSSNGYIVGGIGPNTVAEGNVTDKIIFSTNTLNRLLAVMSSPCWSAAEINSPNIGFIYGGAGLIGNKVKAFTYASEVITAVASLLERLPRASGVSSLNIGYVGGGEVSATNSVKINAFPHSTMSVATTSSFLSAPRYIMGSTQSSIKGYFAGGNSNSVYQSYIETLTFSNLAVNTLSASLTALNVSPASSESSLKGYIAGGQGTEALIDAVDGIRFDNDTCYNTSSYISSGRTQLTGLTSSV